jgi:hypothetical protein
MGPHSRSVCEATFNKSRAEFEGPELNIFSIDKMAGDIVWIVIVPKNGRLPRVRGDAQH